MPAISLSTELSAAVLQSIPEDASALTAAPAEARSEPSGVVDAESSDEDLRATDARHSGGGDDGTSAEVLGEKQRGDKARQPPGLSAALQASVQGPLHARSCGNNGPSRFQETQRDPAVDAAVPTDEESEMSDSEAEADPLRDLAADMWAALRSQRLGTELGELECFYFSLSHPLWHS